MPSDILKAALSAVFVLLLAAPSGAQSFDPPPDEWTKKGWQERKPGEFKRDKKGLLDPSPDVIPLQNLPIDAYGFVDWARAIREGLIDPKEFIPGAQEPGPEDREINSSTIIIKSKLPFMADVVFPHSAHTAWLKCSNCHPKIFAKKAGATPMTMAGIWKGEFCGRCHDKVAFPTRNCFKCHSAPKAKPEP